MDVSKKRAAIFTAITYFISWSMAAWLYFSGVYLTNQNATALLLTAYMFVPALGSVITRLITGQGFSDMRLRPNFKGNVKYYIAAWAGPIVMTIVGCALFFIVFPNWFDPTLSTFKFALEATGADVGSTSLTLLLITQMVSGIFAGGIVNIIPAMGEELGWRGYLLPRLRESLGTRKAIIISGVIWGVWHAPLTAMGHNYGFSYWGYPWLGILTMTFSSVMFGAFLSYIAIKTKSAWPCALSHGVLNAVAGVGIYMARSDYNPILGPIPLSLVGGALATIVGVIVIANAGKLDAEVPDAAEATQPAFAE